MYFIIIKRFCIPMFLAMYKETKLVKVQQKNISYNGGALLRLPSISISGQRPNCLGLTPIWHRTPCFHYRRHLACGRRSLTSTDARQMEARKRRTSHLRKWNGQCTTEKCYRVLWVGNDFVCSRGGRGCCSPSQRNSRTSWKQRENATSYRYNLIKPWSLNS